jgi:hypothetical protein
MHRYSRGTRIQAGGASDQGFGSLDDFFYSRAGNDGSQFCAQTNEVAAFRADVNTECLVDIESGRHHILILPTLANRETAHRELLTLLEALAILVDHRERFLPRARPFKLDLVPFDA